MRPRKGQMRIRVKRRLLTVPGRCPCLQGHPIFSSGASGCTIKSILSQSRSDARSIEECVMHCIPSIPQHAMLRDKCAHDSELHPANLQIENLTLLNKVQEAMSFCTNGKPRICTLGVVLPGVGPISNLQNHTVSSLKKKRSAWRGKLSLA